MMKNILAMAIVAGIWCLAACNNNTSQAPAAGTDNTKPAATTEDRGMTLYQQRCATCHGATGDAQSNPAANLAMSKLDNAAIIETINNGRGIMSPFKGQLADADIALLAVYVTTLRK